MCLLPAGTQEKFMCVCVCVWGGGGGGGGGSAHLSYLTALEKCSPSVYLVFSATPSYTVRWNILHILLYSISYVLCLFLFFFIIPFPIVINSCHTQFPIYDYPLSFTARKQNLELTCFTISCHLLISERIENRAKEEEEPFADFHSERRGVLHFFPLEYWISGN